MKAIIKFKGFQIPVKEGQLITVPKVDAEEGDTLQAEVILYKGPNGLEFRGHKATLKVIEHFSKPLLVFKMRRKTNYRRMYHHEQHYTKVVVEKIE
ncbi:MAG: 50S ribosomal protein L21 [Thermotogae bacterium]|nr:50S ribosomal protein L21 [Thermotogota bacterium]